MLLTNIKVYLKFLSRNRGYTTINLIGFSLALVFVILLGLYVVDEMRADHFHQKGDRIYRLQADEHESSWPAKLGPEIAARYPEVESFVRLYDRYFTVDKGEGGEKIRALGMIADSTFFSLFSFPMAAGDPVRQLQSSSDVTLSEEFAVRLFGTEDPIGKQLSINDYPHTVTGVVSKFPKSHLTTPDIMVRFDSKHLNSWYFENYNSSNFALYLLTRPRSDLLAKGNDMTEWFKTFFWMYQNGMRTKVQFEPITDSYFNTEGNQGPIYKTNSRMFIALLSAAVLAILLFAIINYINLSVALGGFRAKEAAMRRLLGGSRLGLLGSYMLESVVFCGAAFIIAIILTGVIEPTFNRIMESDISLVEALKRPEVIALLVGSVVVLGAVSGLSPAFVITRTKPIEVVKGDFVRRTRMTYSRLFIGFQFCLTIVLIGCAITIGRQTKFMRTMELGFDKENLLYFDNTVGLEKLSGLRDRLMSVPGVEMVSFTGGTPVNGGNNNTNSYEDGTVIGFQVFLGDSLLLDILDIEVLSRTGNVADTALWINQTAARMLNLPPDADSFNFNEEIVGLAGTVNDFHIRDLGSEISPMVLGSFQSLNQWPWDILVKVNSANPAETYRLVKEAYLDYNGGEPFDSGFVDAEIDSWYRDQRRTGTLIGGFSMLAIIISAMGLVAMTTYFMRQRKRDIAVRKVFGATNGQVFGRLVGSFMKIVAVAFVISVPIIVWLMREWLASFAYRIPLGWTIFALAGVSVAAVAFVAVWWQSHMAASRNPVDSLKSE
jgi:putative ABC transport system permease protein